LRRARHDVYVTKLDPSGAKLGYSTFLGGTTSDTGNGVAVDGKGPAYLTGFTASADFPATPNANDSSHNGGNDAFVTRLNQDRLRSGVLDRPRRRGQ
jgi:Beta-propeller repeat